MHTIGIDIQNTIRKFLIEEQVDPRWTEEDIFVWNNSLRMAKQLHIEYKDFYSSEYLEAFKVLNPQEGAIPQIKEINNLLEHVGWKAVYVEGYITDSLYKNLFANKLIPIAKHIRKPQEIMETPTPDFIHDYIGHLPMLFSNDFKNLVQKWAKKSLSCVRSEDDLAAEKLQEELMHTRKMEHPDQRKIDQITVDLRAVYAQIKKQPSAYCKMTRFFIWALEFGVLEAPDGNRGLIGSAMLSSIQEQKKFFDGEFDILSFEDYAMDADIDYTIAEPHLFCAKSIENLNLILDGII